MIGSTLSNRKQNSETLEFGEKYKATLDERSRASDAEPRMSGIREHGHNDKRCEASKFYHPVS